MKRTRVLMVIVAGLMAMPVMAQSSPDLAGWGFRVGAATDPDQLLVGVQYDIGEIVSNLHFVPNLELGLGDDATVLSAAGALHYRFGNFNGVSPYAGGALALGFIDVDLPGGGSDSDFEASIKATVGAAWGLKRGNEFFLEGNLVFGDLHDVEIVAGWRF